MEGFGKEFDVGGMKMENVDDQLFDLEPGFWENEDELPLLDEELLYPWGKEGDVDAGDGAKFSESSVSDAVESSNREVDSIQSGKKRKVLEESVQQNEYVVQLERRNEILAQENAQLRKQLAALKQSNRALQTQVHTYAYAQQPFLVTFAHNLQDAFTVSSAPKPKVSTGATLCVFFLLGAFFLPGLFNRDMDNRDLGMIAGSTPKMALPDYVAETPTEFGGGQDSRLIRNLRSYGKNLLALPMTDSEKQERDGVLMCPKVVSVLRDDGKTLDYVSVVVPSASVTSEPVNGTFMELMCTVNDMRPLSRESLSHVLAGADVSKTV